MNTENPKKPQKLHIRWEMETPSDETADRPDEMCDGFYPSLDREDAGWIGDNPERSFEEQMEDANQRIRDWENDVWEYVGVVAVAHLLIPIGGGSFRIMTLKSGGLWGIESDSGDDYLAEVFEEQKDDLLAELKTLGEALASGDFIQEGEGVKEGGGESAV